MARLISLVCGCATEQTPQEEGTLEGVLPSCGLLCGLYSLWMTGELLTRENAARSLSLEKAAGRFCTPRARTQVYGLICRKESASHVTLAARGPVPRSTRTFPPHTLRRCHSYGESQRPRASSSVWCYFHYFRSSGDLAKEVKCRGRSSNCHKELALLYYMLLLQFTSFDRSPESSKTL